MSPCPAVLRVVLTTCHLASVDIELDKFGRKIMTKNNDENCAGCLFFQGSPAGTHGFCKRFPPVFTNLDDAGRPKFFNPVTSPFNWCGEFED